MKLRSIVQNACMLCCIFLMAVTSACNQPNQSSKTNAAGRATINTQHTESGATRLKYTNGVRAFLEDSKGNTWFGSHNEGACLLRNGQLYYFTTANGLADNQVRCIYEDGNGLIWLECGNGLSTYDGQQMTIYQARDYSAKDKWTLNANDLWFKSDHVAGYNSREGDPARNPGILQYNGTRLFFRAFPAIKDSGDNFSYLVSTPFVKGKKGTFWIGTYTSVLGYDGTEFKVIDNAYLGFAKGTPGLHVRSIMEDSKGNLWIGNNGIGVLKYDGHTVTDFTAQQKLKKEDTKGNSLERVFAIGEDTTGRIWFGTVASGVWRYDGNGVKNYTEADGLASKHIWAIYKSKQGELWFGGADPSGVYLFNGHSFKRKY